MYSIGLDLSLNSTGVCVRDTSTNSCRYFIIASSATKKALTQQDSKMSIIIYRKIKTEKTNDYNTNENIKTSNLLYIVACIEKIIKKFKPTSCSIEGISYRSSSTNALADLAGLNYLVRNMLIANKVSFNIVAPMALKKFAVGNGSADKALMVNAWKNCDDIDLDKYSSMKLDDVADAYFLSYDV